MKVQNLIPALLIVSASAFAQSATVLNWVSNDFTAGADGTPDIVDPLSGLGVSLGSGWLVEIYTADFGTVNTIADGTPSGYTTTVAQGLTGAFGRFGDAAVWEPLAGLDVFTVIWNASTAGLATHWVIVDGAGTGVTPFTLPSFIGAPDASQFTYNAGDVLQADWVALAAIPEPSTYAMILLGGGLLAYRRKRRS